MATKRKSSRTSTKRKSSSTSTKRKSTRRSHGPRAIWTGAISFGLVNVPVRMYSAIETTDLEFTLLHADDGSPIGYEKICKREDKPVPDDEIVKGYEIRKNEYVHVTDEDFAAAKVEGYQHDRDRGVRRLRGDRPDLLRADVLPRAGRGRASASTPCCSARWSGRSWPASRDT